MTLADDVNDGPPEVRRTPTRIDVWLDGASERDRAALLAVLKNAAWRHSDVGDLLRRHGCNVSDVQVGTYRNRRRYDDR